jgi:hypothetical protein
MPPTCQRRPVGGAAADALAVDGTAACTPSRHQGQDVEGARFRRLIRHLHNLGPRATGELLSQLGRVHGLQREIWGMLEEYGALNPAAVERLGGKDWAPPPIEVVP